MPAEARISSIWKKQKLFIALLLLGTAAYFLWDGAVGYPRNNERWTKYEELVEKGKDRDAWKAYANSRKWSLEKPHKFFPPNKIVEQYVCAGVVGTIGLIVLLYWLTQKGRILRSDEEAVYTPAGTRVPFSAITGLGLKQWDSKGIARVRYQLNGKIGEFVLDDYKFDPDPTRQIFAQIEEKLKARTPTETPDA